MQESEQQLVATIRICPRCGAEFAAEAGLKNLCPRCLMQSVLHDSVPPESGDSSPGSSPASQSPKAAAASRPTGFQFKSGDRVLDGYTILAPVGRGGFGEVYHARSDAGKEVALKIVQRFLEVELRGVGHCLNLKHPNLVTIFDARRDSADQHWIVMEFVAGESLAQAIDRSPGGLPVEEVLHWLEGITAAVEHLHDAGIVHRDLKPSNIFDDRGTVKVGDYGLSKFITASRRSGQTQSIGTLHYMAPEIGCGRYGREVDVYAVGVMLHEMLTGEVPFDGETPAEILMKHLTAPPDLSKLPAPFRGIVGRMLAKRPEERYSSLRAVLADLKVRLADAAAGEYRPDDELGFYSSPGLSTWLEAPLATLQQQFAAARFERSDHDRSPELQVQRHPQAIKASDFFSKVLFAFLTVIALVFALYFARSGLAIGVLFAILLALLLPVVPWMLFRLPLRRESYRPGETSRAATHGHPAKPLSGWDGRDLVREPFLSDPRPDEPQPFDPPPSGTGVFGALLIALFWGLGAALLTAGIALLLAPREDEFATLCALGTGFFVAGVIATRCLFTISVPWLRLMAALFCGAAAGLAVGGAALAASLRDEWAALQGTGFGLLIAGILAMRLLGARAEWLLWRAFAGLLAGVGAGLLSAGFMLASGLREDHVALLACAAGFATAGMIWLRLFLGSRRFGILRCLTALFAGAAAGFFVGGFALIISTEEAAAFLGTGTGFMACGITAYSLFVPPRVRRAR